MIKKKKKAHQNGEYRMQRVQNHTVRIRGDNMVSINQRS
jgi:hypothetical protein